MLSTPRMLPCIFAGSLMTLFSAAAWAQFPHSTQDSPLPHSTQDDIDHSTQDLTISPTGHSTQDQGAGGDDPIIPPAPVSMPPGIVPLTIPAGSVPVSQVPLGNSGGTVDYTPAPVPEPASGLLLLIGAAALRRRR